MLDQRADELAVNARLSVDEVVCADRRLSSPRQPQQMVLFELVQEHLEDFVRHAREAYDGPLPKYVKEECRK